MGRIGKTSRTKRAAHPSTAESISRFNEAFADGNAGAAADAWKDAWDAAAAIGPAPGVAASTGSKQAAAPDTAPSNQKHAQSKEEAATDAAAQGVKDAEDVIVGHDPGQAPHDLLVAKNKLKEAAIDEMRRKAHLNPEAAKAIGEHIKSRLGNDASLLAVIDKAVKQAVPILKEDLYRSVLHKIKSKSGGAARLKAAQSIRDQSVRDPARHDIEAAVDRALHHIADAITNAEAETDSALEASILARSDYVSVRGQVNSQRAVEASVASIAARGRGDYVVVPAGAHDNDEDPAVVAAQKKVDDAQARLDRAVGAEMDAKGNGDNNQEVAKQIKQRHANDDHFYYGTVPIETAAANALSIEILDNSAALPKTAAANKPAHPVAPAPDTPRSKAAKAVVDAAVKQVRSAQTAVDQTKVFVPVGVTLPEGFADWSRQQAVDDAKTKLKAAVRAEMTEAGANVDNGKMADAGQRIVDRYAHDATSQSLVRSAVIEVHSDSIVAKALPETNPLKAKQALDQGLATAPRAVKDTVLASRGGQQIVQNVVAWANEPLTEQPQRDDDAASILAQGDQAILRLGEATKGDGVLAGAVALAAVPGYKVFKNAHFSTLPAGWPYTDKSRKAIDDVWGHIDPRSQQGVNAINSLFTLRGYVSADAHNAITSGPEGLALDFDEIGQAKSALAVLRRRVDEDFKKLATSTSGWLDNNIGAYLPAENREAANNSNKVWKEERERLSNQLAEDGKYLSDAMLAMGSRETAGEIKAIMDDPAASCALQAALTLHPELATDDFISLFKPTFSTYGRHGWLAVRLVNLVAATWLRNIMKSAPADLEGAAQAKWLVQALDSKKSILGIASADLGALQGFIDEATAAPNAAGIQKALDGYKTKLSGVKSLAPGTLAGAVVRFAGFLNGAYMVYNTWDKAIATGDPVTYAVAVDLSFLFGVGASNFALSLGADKEEIFGKIAGTTLRLPKVKGLVPLGDAIIVVWAGLTAINSAQLFAKGDIAGGTLQGLAALGFGAAVAPSLGAPLWVSPAGMALASIATIAQVAYAANKEAHRREPDARNYLLAANNLQPEAPGASSNRPPPMTVSADVADVFGQQAGIGDITSAGQTMWPWLFTYAEHKHEHDEPKKDPEQMKRDVLAYLNGLPRDKLEGLWHALSVISDLSGGNPSNFFPPQAKDGRTGIVIPVRRLEDFERSLKYDDIPLLP